MTIKKHIKALLNGNIKNYDLVLGIRYYLRAKGKRKNIFTQLKELCILSMYWKIAPSHYFLLELFLEKNNLPIEELKKFLPNNIYHQTTSRTVYDIVCDDKALFADLMNYYSIPHPVNLFKYRKGVFYNMKNNVITDNDVNNIIQSSSASAIFAKLCLGWSGAGLERYSKDSGNGNFQREGLVLTADFIRKHFENSYFLFQEAIEQADYIAQFNSTSINTIRINSKLIGEEVFIFAAALRMGRKGVFLDNAHAGGISVNINVDNGKLSPKAKAYYTEADYYEHPDSNVKFEDFQIPNWDEVINVTKRAHQVFYGREYVAWDIAVSKNGIQIIEMNAVANCDIFQLSTGSGLADRFFEMKNMH